MMFCKPHRRIPAAVVTLLALSGASFTAPAAAKPSTSDSYRQLNQPKQKRLEQLAAQASNLDQLISGLREYERDYLPSARPSGWSPTRRLADAKGTLRLPVAGLIVRRYGEKDGSGNVLKGILLRTRPGAQVVAPFDCTISFAKPYRNFGQLLILLTADGYHFVLAGMEKIYGVEGQKLLEGEPVGRMGTAEQTELYFQIREKGQVINPLPWLAAAARQEPTP